MGMCWSLPGCGMSTWSLSTRDRAIRIATNEAGLEYIEIDGRASEAGAVGTLGNVASAGKSMEWRLENSLNPGAFSYADGLRMAPGSCDAHERIKVLDGDGIDVAVLYHTIIVQTQSEWKDADLSAAYARAYNRWIADFCEPYPDRLIPIPHLSMLDVELAVSEFQRVAGLGARAVNIGMEARRAGHTGTQSTTRFGRRRRSRGCR